MPKFIHIDHSLCGVGGHEHDGAVTILQAAEQAGFDVVLAANQRFVDYSLLPKHWPVHSIFPDKPVVAHRARFPVDLHGMLLPTSLELEAEHAGNDPRPLTNKSTRLSAILRQPRRVIQARRRVASFADACRQLFGRVEIGQGDHVFLATFNEFDLAGLANYLLGAEETLPVQWHLLFHLDLYAGKKLSAANRRKRWNAVRQQFAYAQKCLPNHQITFNNTTEQLVAQYDALGVQAFRKLPYPVGVKLHGSKRATASSPSDARTNRQNQLLRVTCAGSARRDKGFRKFGDILRALREEHFLHGRIELAAQVANQSRRRLGGARSPDQAGSPGLPLVALPHPLPPEEYRQLIRDTDIGLFLYDNRSYRRQCSAIMQEMLAAGKPVIVPAGSWLSDQLEEPTYRHLECLRECLPVVGRFATDNMSWRCTSHAATGTLPPDVPLTFSDRDTVETELAVPSQASECVFSFRWPTAIPSTYIRVESTQYDADGTIVAKKESILCGRPNNSIPTLLHVHPQTMRLVLKLSNAYHRQTLMVTDTVAEFLDSRRQQCPSGAVGLSFASVDAIAAAVREMVEFYPHFAQSAEAFSETWCREYHPANTIATLTGRQSLQVPQKRDLHATLPERKRTG